GVDPRPDHLERVGRGHRASITQGLHSCRSMTRFQKLAIAATTTTFALIGVGGLVRATGSGEGCPNWPGCFPGRFLPPLRYHPLIEWSHRTLVGIDSILIGILAVAAIVAYRRTR